MFERFCRQWSETRGKAALLAGLPVMSGVARGSVVATCSAKRLTLTMSSARGMLMRPPP